MVVVVASRPWLPGIADDDTHRAQHPHAAGAGLCRALTGRAILGRSQATASSTAPSSADPDPPVRAVGERVRQRAEVLDQRHQFGIGRLDESVVCVSTVNPSPPPLMNEFAVPV